MRHACAKTYLFLTLVLISSDSYCFADPDLQSRINKAIDNGVEYLKSAPIRTNPDHTVGLMSLRGWVFLEAGLPADDPLVTACADHVRGTALAKSFTYSRSLAIIFLDRLGDPNDSLLIKALGVRILEGQFASGGWSYYSGPEPIDPAGQQLVDLMGKYYKAIEQKDVLAKKAHEELVIARLRLLLQGVNPFAMTSESGDNSNTQFAALALWVARRHGVPVDRALQITELRFRQSQHPDGTWGYNVNSPHEKSVGIVSAGVIAITLGRAATPKFDRNKLLADPPVRKSFAFVKKFFKDLPTSEPQGNIYYGLWSLERMAVMFDLKTIEGVDWYEEGARFLVSRQQADGRWSGGYEDPFTADTCFALLFLKRANPAKDITTQKKDPTKKIDLGTPLEKKPTEPSRKSSRLSTHVPLRVAMVPLGHHSASLGFAGTLITALQFGVAGRVQGSESEPPRQLQ